MTPLDQPADRHVLWGHEVSLFSGKARAYLRAKRIPFEERTPSLAFLKNELIPRLGTHLIPVVGTPDGLLVQDTTQIIDFLESRFPEPSIYPETPAQTLAALLLESYGDDALLPHAMHYRWNFFERNREIVAPDFGALVDPALGHAQRLEAGAVLQQRMRGMLPGLGVGDATVAAIEADTTALWAELDAHFSAHEFLLGGRPSIADCGLIGPLYAHLYRDPYPGDLMRRSAPALAAWIERMNSETPSRGEYRSGDEIPESLLPILRRVFTTWMPIGLEMIRAMAEFRRENPGARIPRFLAPRPVVLLGVPASIAVRPDAQWKLQRPLGYYQSLPANARAACDALLDAVGGRDAMQTRVENPVRRVFGRICWDVEAGLRARHPAA